MGFVEGLVAIVGAIALFALPPIAVVIVLLKFNASRNKERMAMIQQGIMPQEAAARKKGTPDRLRTLRTALGAIGVGIGAVVGIVLNNYVFSELGDGEKIAVLAGAISLFFGIGYVIYFIISKDKIEKESLIDTE